jgi:hypothetical protein
VRGVADGEARGDKSEKGECEVDGVVQDIAAEALFEVRAKVSTGDTRFLASYLGDIRMGLRQR